MSDDALFGDEAKPIVCPFRIIVDNQEQAPWHFTNIETEACRPFTVPLITDRHLETGDYSIDGFEDRMTIERKSLADFYGSISHDHDREKRKAERMGKLEYAAYVIESDFTEISNGPARGNATAALALGTMASWSLRFGIHFWPMPGRRAAELWCFRLLHTWWKHREEERKAEEKPAKDAERRKKILKSLDLKKIFGTEEAPF